MPGVAELLAKIRELEALLRGELTPEQLAVVKYLISTVG